MVNYTNAACNGIPQHTCVQDLMWVLQCVFREGGREGGREGERDCMAHLLPAVSCSADCIFKHSGMYTFTSK